MANNLMDKARQYWQTIGNQKSRRSITPKMVNDAGKATVDAIEFATPYIGINGNWWIAGKDTGHKATGNDGKSAYELAVEVGYSGTEEQFNYLLATVSSSASQIFVNKENIENLQNLFGNYTGAFKRFKNVSSSTIFIEKDILHYKLTIAENSTINLNAELIASDLDADIEIIVLFDVIDFVSIQMPGVIWTTGNEMTNIGLYCYKFTFEKNEGKWYSYKEWDYISHILSNGKYLFVDGSKGLDSNNGLSWDQAKQTIQAALDVANSDDGVMVRAIDDGAQSIIYKPTYKTDAEDERSRTFYMRNSVHLFGGCVGTELNPSEIAMQEIQFQMDYPSGAKIERISVPVYETVLSGDLNESNVLNDNYGGYGCRYMESSMKDNCYTVVTSNVVSRTVLFGFVIEGGYNNKDNTASAVSDPNKNLQLRNSIVRNNFSKGTGTGTGTTSILHYGNSYDCIIEYNTSYKTIAKYHFANFVIERYNYSYDNSNITGDVYFNVFCNFENVLITSNRCEKNNSTLNYITSIYNSSITYNNAGTLFSNNASGNVYIVNVNIAFNQITSCFLGKMNVANSILNGNKSSLLISATTNEFLMQNSLVAHNNFTSSPVRSSKLINCTCVSNKITSGAFISGGTFQNCVIWGNTSNYSSGSVNYCAVEEIQVEGIENIVISSSNADVNSPCFANPKPAGITEEMFDYRIIAGSALIDKGNSNYLSGEALIIDIAGNERIVSDAIDIGAYEYQNS